MSCERCTDDAKWKAAWKDRAKERIKYQDGQTGFLEENTGGGD